MSDRLKFIRSLSEKKIEPPKIKIGNNTFICSTSKIGNEGFGFEPDETGQLIYFPHFMGVEIGENVRIGSYSCIDRGNLKNTKIGNGTKIDNLVHIGHNVEVGENCLIVAGSIICGSVKINDNCFIGANSVIKEHLEIGKNSKVGMGSVVTKNIPPNEIWAGNPAKKIENKKFYLHQTSIVETDDIGEGTKIWAFSHISKNVKIGKNCVIGERVYIGPNVTVGDNCKIQNNSLIYEGVSIDNNVFIGPNVVTTNDIMPNVSGDWSERFKKTLFKSGCSIGANSTIVCGVVVGENSLVGAGSVVTKDVPQGTLGYGNPFKVKKYLKSE